MSYQGLGHVDEVMEAVLLVQQLAILVPLATQLLAAAHMGDGIDEAAIEQGETRRAEVGVHAGAIGAVAIDQQGGLARLEQILAIDQGDRHLDPVPGLDPESLALVALRLESRHRLLLEQGALAAGHVQLEGGGGRGHGAVAVAQQLGIRLGVVGQAGDIGGVVEGDLFLLAALPVDLPQPGQPLAALLHHQPLLEQGIAFQQHVGLGRHHRLPAIDRALLGFVEAEVLAVLVGTHIEATPVVIQAVFVIRPALEEQPRRLLRIGGIDEPGLVRGGAGKGDDDEIFRSGLADADVEGVILLLIDQLIPGGIRAEHMAVDLIGQQGLRVLAHVEQGLVVRGPDDVARGVLQGVASPLAALQVQELYPVLAPGEVILRHCQPAVVPAHFQGAQLVEVMPLGALVAVEQGLHLLARHRLAGMDAVLLARLEAGLVAIAVLDVGDGGILLGYARHHLLIEPGPQRGARCEPGRRVGILGVEIGQHLGVLALVVPQPVIVVDPGIPMLLQVLGMLGRLGWLGGAICHRHICHRHGGLIIGVGSRACAERSQQQEAAGKAEHVASLAI